MNGGGGGGSVYLSFGHICPRGANSPPWIFVPRGGGGEGGCPKVRISEKCNRVHNPKMK